MKESIINIVDTVLKSLSFRDLLQQNILIVTSKKMEILYHSEIYSKELSLLNPKNLDLTETAFFISHLRRTTSNTENNFEVSNVFSTATPIYDSSETIVAYIGFICRKAPSKSNLVLLSELLSRLISHELSKKKFKQKVDTINQFNIPYFNERETEVTKLITEGKKDCEISLIMNISVSTVRAHIANIFDRIDINSRTQLVEFYFNTKIEYLLEDIISKGEYK